MAKDQVSDKKIDSQTAILISGMIKEMVTKAETDGGLGFNVERLLERVEEAQNYPTARSGNNKINLIELMLIKMHGPKYTSQQIANYFGVDDSNVRKAIIKYGFDTKSTIDHLKKAIISFAAVPIREEFKASINLHNETQKEIANINILLTTLRNPTTGMLYEEYLNGANSDYYIKTLEKAEIKKIKLISTLTQLRSKALQYFEYEGFIANVLEIVTKRAGIGAAQAIQQDLEGFLDTYGFGTAPPQPKQIPEKTPQKSDKK